MPDPVPARGHERPVHPAVGDANAYAAYHGDAVHRSRHLRDADRHGDAGRDGETDGNSNALSPDRRPAVRRDANALSVRRAAVRGDADRDGAARCHGDSDADPDALSPDRVSCDRYAVSVRRAALRGDADTVSAAHPVPGRRHALTRASIEVAASWARRRCASAAGCRLACLMSGAEGQSRTGDTTIFSRVLYHLSYLGTVLKLDTAHK